MLPGHLAYSHSYSAVKTITSVHICITRLVCGAPQPQTTIRIGNGVTVDRLVSCLGYFPGILSSIYGGGRLSK